MPWNGIATTSECVPLDGDGDGDEDWNTDQQRDDDDWELMQWNCMKMQRIFSIGNAAA